MLAVPVPAVVVDASVVVRWMANDPYSTECQALLDRCEQLDDRLLALTWHESYRDLGMSYFDERDRRAVGPRLVKRLPTLDYAVTLTLVTAA